MTMLDLNKRTKNLKNVLKLLRKNLNKNSVFTEIIHSPVRNDKLFFSAKKKPFCEERLPDLGRRYEKLSFLISDTFLYGSLN